MSFLVVVLVIAVVVAMLLWLGALADASDYPPAAYVALRRTKRSTITLVALTFMFGAVWYWLAFRADLRREARNLDFTNPA